MENQQRLRPEDMTLSRKISFLGEPNTYGESTRSVEIKETHMSVLFLTDQYAYKLKKPVKFDCIDFTTLQARMTNCSEELRINSALAPEVYLDLVPLNLDSCGNLHLYGKGQVVDWLIKMKRLPDQYLLNHAILNKEEDYGKITEVAQKLADFYLSQDPKYFSVPDFQNRLRNRIQLNYTQLSDPFFQLSSEKLRKLLEVQMEFIQSKPDLLAKRIQSGKIIEAHGDLKPEHISLGSHPVIIDRLEFDEDLRIQDMAEDLSLLYIECEILGNDRVGRLFINAVEQCFNESIPEDLLNFYRSKQACLRAKFAMWHLKEEQYRDDPKWRQRADRCLELAEKYADTLH